MAREPEELVEMRRLLGAQLAACREAAQLSQGQLAIPAAVDRTTVNHIEKGRSRGNERFWKIVDGKCRADGALLAGFHAWQAAKQDHDVRTREAQLAEARAKADALRATAVSHLLRQTDRLIVPGVPQAMSHNAAPDSPEPAEGPAGPLASLTLVGSLAGDVSAAVPEEVVRQLAQLLCEWIGAMNRNRRELFELLGRAAGAAASCAVTGLDTDELERLTRAIISPDRVDEQVIHHLAAMLATVKRQQDALGAHAVLPTALGQRSLVHDLLRECPASLKPQLLSVYSDMSTSIGYYFFDLDDSTSASLYWDQARKAAHDAGNIELSIYALGEMSHAACWQGNAHTAIDTAAAAQNLLRKTDDPIMQVYVADRAAQAHAIDGHHQACMAECEKAQDGLASAGQASVESPAYWYNEGLLASEKSGCLLRLRKPQEAVASANNGLALFDNSYVNNRGFCMLFLGNARLQSREIDEAARVIGDAAGLATRTRSARLVRELRTTRAGMQPWQNTPAVKGLDDQLAAYGLAPSSAT